MTTTQPDAILAWHFLPADRKLRFPPHTLVEVGQTLDHDGQLKMCESGLHASVRAIDALDYAPGPVVCRVECWGDVEQGADKLVCRHRRVLAMADVTRELHLFACDEAERALALVDADPRSVEAIRVKRLWVDGKATDHELDAARDAARDAASAAAWDAASAAAWSAAWSALSSAARAAASAAARDAANARLEAVLTKAIGMEDAT